MTASSIGNLTATSDTRSLLNALSKTFSNTTTFIGEMLQNARRAGATLIDIEMGEDTFSMADDGIGIADFGKLLSIAISGWEQQIQNEEAPYGMGFFSIVYAAKKMEVQSMGRRFTASREQILNLEPIPIEAHHRAEPGTKIILTGLAQSSQELLSAIMSFSRGFPVPVQVDGELIKRPDAQDENHLVQTPYGWASLDAALGGQISRTYLQGLPIALNRPQGIFANILHLDPRQFHGRLPDRAELSHADEAYKRLKHMARIHAIERLEKLCSSMDECTFVTKYGQRLCELRAVDALSNLSHVPPRWVFSYGETPRLREYNDGSGKDSPSVAVSRTVLEQEGLYDIDGASVSSDSEMLLLEHVLFANGKMCIADSTAGHWIKDIVRHVSLDSVTVAKGEERRRETVEIFGRMVSLVLLDSLHARLTSPIEGLPDLTELPFHFDEHADELVFTRQTAEQTYLLIYQVSNFVNGASECWDELAEQASADQVEATIMAMLNDDPSRLVLSALRSSLPFKTPNMLCGQTFAVQVDDEGAISVTLET